jgi:VWFA-related protein
MTTLFSKLRPARALSVLLVLAMMPGPAGAQTFVDTTQVVVVEVPVQVIRDGEPVRGLTAANFEVFDGRKKVELTGFEEVDLAEVAPDAAVKGELPVAARRHFLVLFDMRFSTPAAILKARKAAQDMVDSLHPTDLVAVGTYSGQRGPYFVLGFTSDRRQIALALETLGAPELFDGQPADPLRLAMGESNSNSVQVPGMEGRGNSAKAAGEEVGAEILRTVSRLAEEERAVAVSLGVRHMTESMTNFARVMGGIQGRKHVVWLSEGFDPRIIMGAGMEPTEQAGPLDGGSTDGQYGGTQALNAVERMLEELRRADCVVQAVDIAGLRGMGELGGAKVAGQEVLVSFAKSTGGELYENTNDLGGAMQQMLRRTGVTYVLSFQPEEIGKPESFHRLRVEVKDQPRGTRVVHRPGWYAPKPYAARSPLEKIMSAASQLMGGEEGGPIRASLLAAPFHAAGGKAYVPVLLEVDGPSLLAGAESGTIPAELYVYALDALDRGGAVHGYVAQTIGLDVAKVGAALKQSGLKFFGHLDLPPGDYRLRVLVRNGATGATTVRSVPLTVPSFTEAGPVLLPPFFPEPTGKWLLVREAPRKQGAAPQTDVPYPFLLGEEPYVPASKPVLVPGQEAKVALVVYNLGAGSVRVRARVLGADGKEIGGGRFKLLEHKAGPPDRLTASYDPPSLQPGEYTLQVTLTDGGGVSRTSATPFVVGG